MLQGLHHVTAIAGEPRPLLAFYRDQLGFPGMLRLTRDDGSRIAFMRMQATRRSS